MALDPSSFPSDPTRPDWLDRLVAIGHGPDVKCSYLDDATLREILAEADVEYRCAENDLRRRFPELYGYVAMRDA